MKNTKNNLNERFCGVITRSSDQKGSMLVELDNGETAVAQSQVPVRANSRVICRMVPNSNKHMKQPLVRIECVLTNHEVFKPQKER